jgi:hypothetical protein
MEMQIANCVRVTRNSDGVGEFTIGDWRLRGENARAPLCGCGGVRMMGDRGR